MWTMSTTARSLSKTALRPDPAWPAELRLLLGPDAVELNTEYFAALDGDVVGYRPRQVAFRPGRSTTVRYDVRVRWSDTTSTTEQVVAMTGNSLPERAIRMGRNATEVSMWRWPDDPMLPGLATALDVGHVERLFADLGLGTGAVELRVRAYRPGRRAVVEASNGQARVFLKVVRPRRAAALHLVHRELAGELPVPDSIGWTDDGIVVLPGIGGTTLREVLRHGGESPAPAELDDLLDRLPASLAAAPARPHWLVSARHHASVIAATVPAVAAQVDDLVDDLTARSDMSIEQPLVAVHGDMYESQLMVQDGRIVGLLDVDTAGAGHRIDDHANFCAHLSVLALVTRPSNTIRRYGSRLLAHAETVNDRADLRLRIAASVLGLATGSFRVLEDDWAAHTARRLDLASEWIASADRAAITR
jgi:hypothetical protein